jgi:hypothetical protein
MFIEHHPNHLK